uniref:Uncharacterized protein n=1 Tax=Caenorhabditis tropicalis TaxID=1561998 RepID=A0A1I7T7F4_9PELO
MSLQNFYARAYQEEYGNKLEGKETLDEEKINDILASKSAVSFPIQTEFIREESKEEEEGRPSPNGLSDNLEPVPLTHFDPAVKYGKEKEFRYAANKIFLKVFQHYSSTNSNCSEEEKRVKDVVNLIEK